jgi:hypothetical protein
VKAPSLALLTFGRLTPAEFPEQFLDHYEVFRPRGRPVRSGEIIVKFRVEYGRIVDVEVESISRVSGKRAAVRPRS